MVLQVFVCLSLNITQKLLADFDEIFSIDHVGDVQCCLSVGDITPKVVDGFWWHFQDRLAMLQGIQLKL